ncbi:phage tail domain-containing protein [Oceanobacillus sp. Castelsardo]|uniref:phage tail domain-containing protein n=1 Tax=Oceanobacillus sp. Castelsardo TaxID=1851204 RepID=UPI000837DB72|nr:phage tail domain-containing protein [Oceanobacillus sp. Castelsardo]
MQDLFQIYDLDFKPIPLPKDELEYGLKGMGLVVSSVGQEVTEHSIPGLPGTIITGVRDAEREISLKAWLESKDNTDFLLKRDRVYSFFKRLGSFYVTETRQGNKLMKVRVIEQYSPEIQNGVQTLTTFDIPLKIDGQPYWISRFTSLDLDEKGVPFNNHWSFGMGLDTDPDRLTYVHSNKTSFNIYNAGTVPIKTVQEKGNCMIVIDVLQSVNNFRLYDATGRYFEYNPMKNDDWVLSSGSKIILNGHYMTLNNTPILERTNRYFLNLLPGDNKMKVEGLSNYIIAFDFRFKYD